LLVLRPSRLLPSAALAAALLLVAPESAFANCTNPTAGVGEVIYNGDYATMQFCNGSQWISMAASGALTEVDPKVGTLTPNNFCTSNPGGTQIVCTTASIGMSQLSATGTPSSTTYLRGDGTWATISTGFPALTSTYIWVGNAANAATAVALSGDATLSNAGALTIANSAITNAKLSNMAASTIKGNNTASSAAPLDLTATQVTAMLNTMSGDSGSGGTKGLVPAPAAGDAAANKYLSAAGTWATVSAGATPAGTVAGAVQFRGATAVLAANDTKFIWDNTNFRLGIGTATPSADIETPGTVKSTSYRFAQQTGLPAPSSASGGTVGTLTANDFCTANGAGTQVVCTTATINATTQISGAGTSGYVQFSNNGGLATDSNFFWDNTNKRLGIGTAVPLAPLHVNGTNAEGGGGEATYHGTIEINDNFGSGTGAGGLEFKSSNYQNGFGWRIGAPDLGSGNAPLVFQYRANSASWSEALRISNTGNVGIGTTSPLYLLDLRNSSGASQLHISSNADDQLFINANPVGGNFAAFTTTPNGSNPWTAKGTASSILAVDAGYIAFYTNTGLTSGASYTPSERMIIDGSGNLGIGTGAPTKPFHLYTGVNDPALVYNTSDTNWNRILFQKPSSLWDIGQDNSNGFAICDENAHACRVLIDSTGRFRAAIGFQSQAGAGGGTTANVFNVYWSSNCASLWIDTTNIGNIACNSDRRLKENILDLPETDGLAAIEKLHPVTFKWKHPEKGIQPEKQYGFVAQEVRDVLPDLVHNTGMKTQQTPDGTLKLDYNGLVPPMVKAIQELKAANDTLRKEFEAYKAAHP
jgi:hypothetical protein